MWLDISISTNKNSGQVYNLRGDNFVGEMLCFERENIPPPRLTGIKDYSKNVHWRLNTNRCVVIFLFLDLTHTKITFNKTFVFTFWLNMSQCTFFWESLCCVHHFFKRFKKFLFVSQLRSTSNFKNSVVLRWDWGAEGIFMFLWELFFRKG